MNMVCTWGCSLVGGAGLLQYMCVCMYAYVYAYVYVYVYTLDEWIILACNHN